ncbi:MFS transporter [Gordonia sp. ABSL1-1]|uniref:MFS transporter n=1 Tax=Gordonia sp. ABSL1-1 TaxID=3053923 RepID=UPI00257468CC|nr:MFS transporter [Gordonia sp. ABSL1-1]MDL9936776.1 MFS transporter [Gordonia sp. ABSL1-1]
MSYSPTQISALFVVWSVTAFVAELPTGVVADRFSRRRLIVASPIVTAAGFALWTWWPSLPAYAAGFVLWGVGGALRSGSAQALVYDELAACGQAGRYPVIAGRIRAAESVGVLGGTVAAAPLLSWGGYAAAGAASVAACVVSATAAAFLPESHCRTVGDDSVGAVTAEGGWRQVVRDGGRVVRSDAAVRWLVGLVVALTWVAALDEYLPLLAESILTQSNRSSGSVVPEVAALMLIVDVGVVAGGLAARWRPGTRMFGGVLGGGALALAAAAVWERPAAMLLVAMAFGVFTWAHVVTEAALQDRLSPRSRATVGSIVGVGEEVVAVGAFGAWALGSRWCDPAALFAVAAGPYVVVAAFLIVGGRVSRPVRRPGERSL